MAYIKVFGFVHFAVHEETPTKISRESSAACMSEGHGRGPPGGAPLYVYLELHTRGLLQRQLLGLHIQRTTMPV